MTRVTLLFINQMAGPMFRELAEDLSNRVAPGLLVTGHPDTTQAPRTARLIVVPAPPYDRTSFPSRLVSWLRYALHATLQALRTPGRQFGIFVSNPPFIGLLGLALRALRGDRYAMLVYDVYPDVGESFGKLAAGGVASRVWRMLNRLTFEHADVVFTLGTDMAAALRRQFDPRRTRHGDIVVIPPWADTQVVVPVPPQRNPFREAHASPGQLVVMYSGNFGLTHDIETIVRAARLLRSRNDIRFLFIGTGAKRPVLEEFIASPDGGNARLLTPVAEADLRFSMSAADVAVAALEPRAAGLSFPSKTLYYLAAGAAVILLAPETTDVARAVSHHQCGYVVRPGDHEGLAARIVELAGDRVTLARLKAAARKTAEEHFHRGLSVRFAEVIATCMGTRG